MHYVLSIDVKRVEDGGPETANTRSNPTGQPKRSITDELHIVRKTETLPVAVEYAIHVLTMERNTQTQATEATVASHEEVWGKIRTALNEAQRLVNSSSHPSATLDQLADKLTRQIQGTE